MICETCHRKEAETGRRECFRCRVASVGFTFIGGGGYGRAKFSERTTSEFMAEHVGEIGPDVEPVPQGVWS